MQSDIAFNYIVEVIEDLSRLVHQENLPSDHDAYQALGSLVELCDLIHLPTTAGVASDLMGDLNISRTDIIGMRSKDSIEEALRVLRNEGCNRWLLPFDPNRSKYLEQGQAVFIGAKLPRCIETACWDDLSQAMYCYALHIPTACVFHCCRILEAVLVGVVWPSVGRPVLKDHTKPTWGMYLGSVSEVVASQNKKGTRTEDWDNQKVLFYQSLLSDYSKVKDAERASVAHSGVMFEDRQATSLISHTASLLKNAAIHFDDEGEYRAPTSAAN